MKVGGRRPGWRGTSALIGSALAGAAAPAVAPAVGAERPGGTENRHLASLEAGFSGHGGARADTRANLRRELRQVRRCADAGCRTRNRATCPSGRRYAGRPACGAASKPLRRSRSAAGAPPSGSTPTPSTPPSSPRARCSGSAGRSATTAAQAWLRDPATGRERAVPPPVDDPDGTRRPANLFCSGHALLTDGRLLVAGGNLGDDRGEGPGEGWKGSRWLFTFNPWNETWTRQRRDMAQGRWYPTVTALPDGTAPMNGGWDGSGDQTSNDDVELFTPWRALDGADGTVAVKAQRPYAQLSPTCSCCQTRPRPDEAARRC